MRGKETEGGAIIHYSPSSYKGLGQANAKVRRPIQFSQRNWIGLCFTHMSSCTLVWGSDPFFSSTWICTDLGIIYSTDLPWPLCLKVVLFGLSSTPLLFVYNARKLQFKSLTPKISSKLDQNQLSPRIVFIRLARIHGTYPSLKEGSTWTRVAGRTREGWSHLCVPRSCALSYSTSPLEHLHWSYPDHILDWAKAFILYQGDPHFAHTRECKASEVSCLKCLAYFKQAFVAYSERYTYSTY